LLSWAGLVTCHWEADVMEGQAVVHADVQLHTATHSAPVGYRRLLATVCGDRREHLQLARDVLDCLLGY